MVLLSDMVKIRLDWWSELRMVLHRCSHAAVVSQSRILLTNVAHCSVERQRLATTLCWLLKVDSVSLR